MTSRVPSEKVRFMRYIERGHPGGGRDRPAQEVRERLAVVRVDLAGGVKREPADVGRARPRQRERIGCGPRAAGGRGNAWASVRA
jgi:hypothetical protein